MKVKKPVKKSAKSDEVEIEATEWIGMVRISQSSVEIIQDAKGGIKATVKAYADTAEDAADIALKTFNKLKQDMGI